VGFDIPDNTVSTNDHTRIGLDTDHDGEATDKDYVLDIALDLFREFSNSKNKVRLVGIKLSNFERNPKTKQTNLAKYALI